MTAEKGNKVYTIDESMKVRYQADGFDIKDEEGKLIAGAKGKTIPYEKYKAVLDELNALKDAGKEGKEDEFSSMSVEELKVYAETNNINLGNASSQSGIAKKIREALKERE